LGGELLRSVKHCWKARGGCVTGMKLACFAVQKAFVSSQVPPHHPWYASAPDETDANHLISLGFREWEPVIDLFASRSVLRTGAGVRFSRR